MDNKKQQTGLWIDSGVLFSDLSLVEKMVLADVLVLSSGKNEYHKTNPTIAKVFNVSTRTITRAITTLSDKGLIQVKITRPYGTVKADRYIKPCYKAIAKYTKSDCDGC